MSDLVKNLEDRFSRVTAQIRVHKISVHNNTILTTLFPPEAVKHFMLNKTEHDLCPANTDLNATRIVRESQLFCRVKKNNDM